MGEQHMPGRKGDERRREAWGALRHSITCSVLRGSSSPLFTDIPDPPLPVCRASLAKNTLLGVGKLPWSSLGPSRHHCLALLRPGPQPQG